MSGPNLLLLVLHTATMPATIIGETTMPTTICYTPVSTPEATTVLDAAIIRARATVRATAATAVTAAAIPAIAALVGDIAAVATVVVIAALVEVVAVAATVEVEEVEETVVVAAAAAATRSYSTSDNILNLVFLIRCEFV